MFRRPSEGSVAQELVHFKTFVSERLDRLEGYIGSEFERQHRAWATLNTLQDTKINLVEKLVGTIGSNLREELVSVLTEFQKDQEKHDPQLSISMLQHTLNTHASAKTPSRPSSVHSKSPSRPSSIHSKSPTEGSAIFHGSTSHSTKSTIDLERHVCDSFKVSPACGRLSTHMHEATSFGSSCECMELYGSSRSENMEPDTSPSQKLGHLDVGRDLTSKPHVRKSFLELLRPLSQERAYARPSCFQQSAFIDLQEKDHMIAPEVDCFAMLLEPNKGEKCADPGIVEGEEEAELSGTKWEARCIDV